MNNQKKIKDDFKVSRFMIVILWLIFVLLPFYAAIIGSLTPYSSLGEQLIFPKYLHFENYIKMFTEHNMFSYLKASTIYAIGSSILVVIIGSLSAYAITRFNFIGRGSFVASLLVVQILPQVVVIVPTYLVIVNLGLFDTFIGVIIVIVATSLPFPTLLLMNFFRAIPEELEEAALLDGCNRLQTLIRIIVPLALPGIMTALILAFFVGWGEYLYAMVLTNSTETTPLTLGISRLIDNTPPWELIMTGSIISVIPPVILFIFAQRYIIHGLVSGGGK